MVDADRLPGVLAGQSELDGAGRKRPKWRLPGWSLSLYPEAREAAGYFRSSYDPAANAVRTERGESADPERSERVAASRARTAVRRYCAANRTNRFGTLTYGNGGCRDPKQVRRDVGEFFRNLRMGLGGRPLPYVWVPEFHADGERFHVHFAVARYIRRSLIEDAWGRRHVHIKLLGDLPVGSSEVDEARQSARYLSKYFGKDMGSCRELGLHRYDVAQGFKPRQVKLFSADLRGVIGDACDLMGGRPQVFTTSDEWPQWGGPFVVAMSWLS